MPQPTSQVQAAHATTKVGTGLRATSYAVIDVETTGLDPRRDRIVELAIIRLNATGQPVHQYTTMVRPDQAMGATHIHGLAAHDVAPAPPFNQIAHAVAARLLGAVLVAHNAAFDLAFLRAAFARAQVPMPPWPAVCTKRLAQLLARKPPGGWSLAACCRDADILLEDAHTALADARATARLFAVYLAQVRTRRPGIGETLEALGCDPLLLPPTRWRTGLPYTSRQHPRRRP